MTTVEIPTSVCVTVAAYVAGAYISGVVVGWTESKYQYEASNGLEWLIVVFWPFVVLIGVVTGLAAVCRFTAKRFPCAVKWTDRVWFVLTLPFRPMTIGYMLKDKWRRK